MMRSVPISLLLALVACSASLADVPHGRAASQDGSSLYDWLVSEEVPTADVILAVPEAAALAAAKMQDDRRYKVGLSVSVHRTFEFGTLRPFVGLSSAAGGALRIRSEGFVWSAVVESPGATALRIGFESFELPEGVELYAYSDEGWVDGPCFGSGPNGRRAFFTRALPGDRVHLQLRYDGTDLAATLESIRFTLSEVAHLDERFLRVRAPVEAEGREHCGNLNEPCVENAECDLHDPVLDPVVENLQNAVGLMLFQSGSSWYLCTGGLIASLDGTPGHFLTANHCISTAAEAASLETYFQFTTACPPGGGGTPSCDFADDSNSDTPSMFGATIVDTAATTDFTLLKLDGELPPGTTHLPFSTAPVATTDGVGLHRISHPIGAPQAYSEHLIDAGFNLCGPPGDFIYSVNLIGATEGGSNGAPVVNEQGEIVGQLYGACGTNLNDECDTVNNRTYDGAFAATWESSPQVRHALAQEPLPTVAVLATHDIPPVPRGETWETSFTNDGLYDNLSFQLTGPDGDGDLYVRIDAPPTLTDWDCRPYIAGTIETCTFDPSQAGTYYVMVHAFSSISGATLTITTECSDADADGVCDEVEICSGDDASGDSDGDGLCDDVDNCPLTSNPGGGVAMFSQTVIAADVATFVWTVPENVLWVVGDLAGVSTYEVSATNIAAAATAIPSGPEPAPGQGSFVLVRADCPLSTWSTGAASECPPGTCAAGTRDELLP